MIIRNYVVDDMYEAMVKIKHDLGSNAVIVSKRSVRQNGFLGFMKKKLIEVTAATESQDEQDEMIRKIEALKADKKNAYDESVDGIKSEMQELRSMVMQLVEKEKTSLSVGRTCGNQNELYDTLIEMDFNKRVIDDFNEYCRNKNIANGDVNRFVLYEFLKDKFEEKVKVDLPKKRTMVFVGPTGVGKTTTIAKIASIESLTNQKKVGLITIDTYRIGAVEQLKIYANILDIPLEVVVKKEEMKAAIEKLSDCDLILVDSTGRNHRNDWQLVEMKKYIDDLEDKNIYLVASMTTKNTDFVEMVKSYERMEYDHIIFTKMDETKSYGNIMNAAYYTDKPISYVCMGQIVPDDVKTATKKLLFKYAWGEVKA